VRITAAGVTHSTIRFSPAISPPPESALVLGNEGAGMVEEGAERISRRLTRDVFGAYGAFEDGTYSEWVAVQKKTFA